MYILAGVRRGLTLAILLLSNPAVVSSAHGDPTIGVLQVPEDGAALRAVNAFHQALAHGDATQAASLLDESAIIYEEGDAETNKSQYVASHLPADIAFLRDVREAIVGRSGHEDADQGWVATQARMSGRYHDKDVDRLTTETMVLRRTPAGWRIVHIHWSSRAAGGG